MEKLTDQARIYPYRVYLNKKCYFPEGDVFTLMFEGEIKNIPHESMEFYSTEQLTKQEVEEKFTGTLGIDKITGDFKLDEIVQKSEYYTPSLEEFHIGFEYEWLNEEGEWIKESTPTEITNEGFNEQTHGLRVKCLDKTDIEDCGWIREEDIGMSENNGMMFKMPQKEYEQGYYTLRYWTFNNRVGITAMQGDVFDGTVNNKSELKRLMKMLNIKKDNE